MTRARGPTLLMGPPDPYGLIGLVQTVLAYHYVVYSADWQLPDALPLSAAPQDLAAAVRPFETATWAELPLAVQIESPRGAVVLLRLTIRRRKLPHYSADLTAEPPIFRVVGLDANYYHWGYCNPRTGRTMAWYGVNRKGAYLRLCQTSPKIRLRLPRNGVREVWQDGYRLVLLPRLAFFALWDGMGEAFVVPRAPARVLEAALPGGSYASGHVPIAESAMMSDAPSGEGLTQVTEHATPVRP